MGPLSEGPLIAQLIENAFSLDEVQDLIGDTTQTVKKLYQDYVVFQQIKNETNLPERPIRDRFSLLEVTLGQRPIKQFLGMPRNLPNGAVEALVPPEKLDNLEEIATWVFGSEDRKAVISDSREITSRLAPVVANPEALEYLRSSNDLESAFEFSDGEKEYLLRKVTSAERTLRDATSVLAFYRDDPDVVAGIERLEALVDGMRRVAS